jgi:hypothetical protein
MLQIREAVFETNSSAVHTFFIKKNFKPKRFSEKKTIKVDFGCYDTNTEKYSNTSFLSYVFSYLASYRYDKHKMEIYVNKINEILKPYNVCIEVPDPPYVPTSTGFQGEVLDPLLANPALFVSAVLCDESHFYTGVDSVDELDDVSLDDVSLDDFMVREISA